MLFHKQGFVVCALDLPIKSANLQVIHGIEEYKHQGNTQYQCIMGKVFE